MSRPIERIVRALILISAVALTAGCATEYLYRKGDTEIEISSYRKFGELRVCLPDANSDSERCLEAIGVDRQSASPLEEAAARILLREMNQ